jgi:hypothetical protein
MTKATYSVIDKKGNETIWEWEETPELRAFVKKQVLKNAEAKLATSQQERTETTTETTKTEAGA